MTMLSKDVPRLFADVFKSLKNAGGTQIGTGDTRKTWNSSMREMATDNSAWQLWMDRVGIVRVHLGNRIEIGGPGEGSTSTRLSLMANLSPRHAAIVRTQTGYFIEAFDHVSLNGKMIRGLHPVENGQTIQLGEDVLFRFRLPSPLSQTAVLDFVSDHRTEPRIDSVVLMEDVCLLGTQIDSHIRYPETENKEQKDEAVKPLVLYRVWPAQNDEKCLLMCKQTGEGSGSQSSKTTLLEEGTVIEVGDLQFRAESFV